MKKENIILFCTYVFCGCFVFNQILGLLGIVGIFAYTLYKKDSAMQQRVLSILLLVVSVLAVQVVVEFVFGTVNYIMLLCDHWSIVIVKINYFVELISYLYIATFIVIGLIYALVKDRDMPIYSTLSRIILGNYTKKESKPANTSKDKDDTKNDNTKDNK